MPYSANTRCRKVSETSRWALDQPEVHTFTDDVVRTAPGVRLLLGRSPTTTAVLCCTVGLGLGCTLTLGVAGWLFGELGTAFGEFGGTDTFGGVTDRLGVGLTFETEGDGAGDFDWELEVDPLEHPVSNNAPAANAMKAFLTISPASFVMIRASLLQCLCRNFESRYPQRSEADHYGLQ
jgi:hypothetical protein